MMHYDRMLPDRQLDLFGVGGVSAPVSVAARSPVVASELDDPALIAAIPGARVNDYRALIDEAVKRQPAGAILALEDLCRRFKGFGLEHPVPEQTAAVEAIAAIGGRDAAQAVSRIMADRVVQGPGIAAALHAAARLGCALPDSMVLDFLRHPVPDIRADAAACAHRHRQDIAAVLADLLGDLNRSVATAAACALGRMGRAEARPMLLRLLAEQPAAELIQAVSGIADESCIVLLGRIARTMPALAPDAIEVLRDMDSERAAAVVASIESAAANGS